MNSLSPLSIAHAGNLVDREPAAANSPTPDWVVPAHDRGLEGIGVAEAPAWLRSGIAKHGPKVWERLLKSLPSDHTDAIRQQLDAFYYELYLAELEDEEIGQWKRRGE